ncbi:MAG TPA: hypothetical protein VK106_06855 [Balneolaceae bacterium]|nr:hypothetical protein [Balneolaceae bacterium]
MADQSNFNRFENLQQTLKYTFTVLPIVAGLDKFFHLLVNWEIYVPGWLDSIIPAATLMIIAGIIEIIAGLIVLTETEIGGYIVALWLLGIAVILITGAHYLDIAVRDIVMAISVYVMARMTNQLKKNPV